LTTAVPDSLRARVSGSTVRGRLSPEEFALVMATGIVSIAAVDQQYHVIALILGVLAAAFALLTVMVGARVARAPAAFGRQLRDPDVALRSFTFVAACGVLATELGQGQGLLAWSLGAAALIAWLGVVPAGDRILAARPATTGLAWLVTLAGPQILILWIMASAWIPLLLSAQLWRVARRPASLHYEGCGGRPSSRSECTHPRRSASPWNCTSRHCAPYRSSSSGSASRRG
jgi:Voltage-dependent anion channel